VSSNILYISIRITLLLTAVFLLFFVTASTAFATIEVSGVIDTATFWTKAQSPIIVNGGLSIQPGGLLNIEPGVVVKFKSSSSLVVAFQSPFTAVGTPGEPIIFTAYTDDTIAGDTNGDGNASVPFPSFWNGIYLYGDNINVSNAEFRYGASCINLESSSITLSNNSFQNCGNAITTGSIFNGSITDNTIHDSSITGLLISLSFGANYTGNIILNSGLEGIVLLDQNRVQAVTTISNNIISGSPIGITVINYVNAIIENNDIEGNSVFGVSNANPGFLPPFIVNAQNNWWGDASGPFHPNLNPGGQGNPVSDGVLFEPVLTSPSVGQPVRRPVIIVPGILGTELYNGGEFIWPDVFRMISSNQFLLDNLSLNGDGNSIHNIDTGDIIRSMEVALLPDKHIFDLLIDSLIEEGYSENDNLFLFPYDWRLDLDNAAEKLHDKIEQVKSLSGFDKVDVVTHSMGGLVVKNYIKQFGEERIGKLIFAGTPHLGAPKAGKVLLRGDSFNIPVLRPATMRQLALNSLSVYQLLPNQEYFDRSPGYILELSGGVSSLDYTETKQYLIDHNLNQTLMNNMESFFAKELHNLDFSGIATYNITGCTLPTQRGYWFDPNDKVVVVPYVPGDKTVPLVSADYINIPAENKFYAKADHGELPSVNGVRQLIAGLLGDEPFSISGNILSGASQCKIKGKTLIWRSPVAVHVYDQFDHHTGPLENEVIEYGIPGVDYDIIDGETFIYLPTDEGQTYEIVADGLETGKFDLLISEDDNGVTGNTFVFDNVQITASTEVKFNISDTSIDNQIELDVNGNNNFETIFADAEEFGDEIYDFTPPEFLVNFDPLVKSFVFSVKDDIDADPEIICDDIQCIAEDWAGNVSALNFYQYEEENHYEINFSEIIYNGEQYGFDINNLFANYNKKKDAEINLIQKYTVNEESVLKINFTGSKNQSKIFIGTEEVEKETLEGLKILQLETKAGIIKTNIID